MELLLLAGLSALVLAHKNSGPGAPTGANPQATATKGAPGAGSPQNVLAKVGAGATVGAGVGVVVSSVVDPYGGQSVKGAAAIGGAVVGGSAALLGLGVLSAVAFTCVAFIVAWVFTLVMALDDAQQKAYGQAGAQRDFSANWQQAHDNIFHLLRAQADPSTTDAEVERQVIPFVDGFMYQSALAQYRVFMKGPDASPGIGVGNLNDQSSTVNRNDGQFTWGFMRGKFVADLQSLGAAPGAVTTDAPPYAFPVGLLKSYQDDSFARNYCPPDEAQWVSSTTFAATNLPGVS